MVADTESSGSLGGSSNAASDKAVDGFVVNCLLSFYPIPIY